MGRDIIKYLLIASVAALLFLPFLGSVHLFDWDEINFAEAAREMLVSKDYMRVQIDFAPFWEKPPLFIWMQAVSMSAFGVNEFAARFPNAVFGMITLCSLFYIGKRMVNERFAWLWVLFYAGSWLSFFYFKTAIIDPVFNFFIFIAFFQVYLIRFENRKLLHAILAGLFLGLAVLTKGPVALLVAFLSLIVYLIYNRGFGKHLGIGVFSLIAFSCALTIFSWFGVDIIQNGWWFTKTFIAYQVRLFSTGDAGHGQPFFYHFVVLLVGCFPASVFLFRPLKRKLHNSLKIKDFERWMWILFWVVLILFSIVKTKIVHYSSLCYFPISFIAAYHLSRINQLPWVWKRAYRVLFLIVGAIWSLALLALPIVANNIEALIPFIKDEFAVANFEADVRWPYSVLVVGFAYLLLVLFCFLYAKRFFTKSVVLFLLANCIFVFVTMVVLTPRIEAYSQRAAIEFYKELAGQDVYIAPVGFKSYAHLFYGKKRNDNAASYHQEGLGWLLHGDVDKPVYFVCKVTSSATLDKEPHLRKIGSKNGFVFYERVR